MTRKLTFLILFLFILSNARSQDKWDVNKAPLPYDSVTITVHEGTWMNLDVSPDGKTIAFDLLGDIFTIPVEGGKATLLREGPAYEVQPRFSPDGKKIAFTSDAGGGDNIWIMDRDGKNPRQVTKESFRLLNNPAWAPEGNYIAARKHFSSTRSLGAGEIWLYHVEGGSGVQLTKRKNDQQDVNEPSFSPDGRYIYFSEDMYPGGYFQYNKDPNSQIYIIRRYDREEGEISNIISGPGGAFRPQVSPDGEKLAFIRRVREKTVLFIHDLKTGREWPIFDQLTKDQQEAWAIFGVYTGYNWMPNNQEIIIWANGKIHKVNILDHSSGIIPFNATSSHKIARAVNFKQEAFSEEFTAKAIRQTITSPDGKTIVFNAAGYLWKKQLPDGTPQRLTRGSDAEFYPSFSPDGKEVVFSTWNDEERGAICKVKLSGGKITKLTREKGIYANPSFSPDGEKIVFEKEHGNNHLGYSFTKDPGIYLMEKDGGEMKKIHGGGSSPAFSSNGERVFFQSGGGLQHSFKSVNLHGEDEKTHFTSKYANRFIPSPDGNWVAFRELFKIYIAPLPKSGQPFDLSANTKAVPVRQVALDAGVSIHWASDSKKLHWTLGENYFTSVLTNHFTFLEGAPDSLPPLDTFGLKIGLKLQADQPEGMIALTNARIITVNKDNEVIENGTILIKNNRILKTGKSGEMDIPAGAKIIDCKGKTIMPGLVDVHAHLGTWRSGISPQKQWSYYANMAYGVTTTHDPSTNTEMVFSQSEMVKAGNMAGPRIFSTGTILYGADGDFKAIVNNLDDARSALRRMKAWGAFSVKSYNQPRRNQRQQIIKAANELQMHVYPEGGSFFYHNMSMILDGHTGIEHNIPVAPVYDDVVQLWKNSGTGYTPTLIVAYGAFQGENYWYQKTNVWEKERLLTFTPRALVDAKARHRTMIPDEEYANGHILVSQGCKKLSDAGVKVNLGAHGQLQGLGAHWELWMLVQGGMSEPEALRAATMNGAEYIGMGDEIGSIEKGKLADLIILEKNPLENIRNSEFVEYTMINGRLYEASTLNEVGNYDRKRSKFYWEQEGYSPNFDWHSQSHSFERVKCSCHTH